MRDQLALTQARQVIGGQFIEGHGPAVVVRDPSTGETLVECGGASPAQVDEALAMAKEGFAKWREVAAADRAVIFRKACDILAFNTNRLALQLTLEQGKTLVESIAEWRNAIEILEWYAGEGIRAYGRIVPARNAHTHQLVERDPVGPVAAFAPWNFPALTPMRKIAGSLAAGCSCVLKAPEETPLSSIAIAEALYEAGLPRGVLSVVFGDAPAIAERLLKAPDIRMMTFTGSTPVGTQLATIASRRVLPMTLELGGHAPVLVFPDADLDRVFATAIAAKFRNAGQICIAPTRFIVHRSLFDQFTCRLREFASSLKMGPGADAGTQMGPVATKRRLSALDDLIAKANTEGAEISRGASTPGTGYFWSPAVITGLKADSCLFQIEPFGPIAPCIEFDSEHEAIHLANNVPFGLAAYLFTRSLSVAHRVAKSLEAGMVGVNTTRVSLPELPFGGVKASGYGSEGGTEGLEDFLITRSVSLDFS
ncbi:NAD-dependent succinate-semialdehyde dehydrogenase [Burkholderia multivorans]|nr:NAD-dependent succinate-semialdehyde dehydrogenase [Burkholderia multivorans]MBU9284114.1 NAD-dependent succinate-semialdehyde dehydrogenase [Burkholderia multivorans]MBU9420747.1 NAD-dependent succinate-semialdehyde dehydrogenase [Burkholderia multivorans]MDN7451287.1 NAD-dependent succinate-semialdehyde dehydrogenase [Burkholderia multivorans]